MRSLRQKIWLGFSALLAVLVGASVLTILVLTHYTHILERVFRENYDSAVFCQGMQESIDELNNRAQQLIWQEQQALQINPQEQETKFSLNLHRQQNNVTLPGEGERTAHLTYLWGEYEISSHRFNAAAPADRPALYRQDLLPQYQAIKQTAQQIADMNMSNMASADGQAKHTLVEVRNVLLALVVAGTALALVVVSAEGAAILKPLKALTDSAQRIQRGDLDLNLTVKSHDEIGQLAEAFTLMAERLREFRRLDHDRLARTQQTTQLAIDSLPDAVFVIGPDERVEISNRTARAHFGIDPGLSVAELSLKWLTPLYESVKRDRRPIEPRGYGAAIQMFEAGEERFLLPHAVPMLKEDGDTTGVAVILVDVTPLRRADEAKSGLISTVSHELRTPLTSVRLSLSLMGNEKLGILSGKHQQLVAAARQDADRLHRIIENLLQMSRIEAGRAPFQFRRMAAREIVAYATDPLRPAFAERGLRLETAVADGTPDVSADPVSIGSALTNLLSNALKYTPPGGEVKVTATADGAMVRFGVTDSGPGIPEPFQSRIFEKFFRVPSPSGPTGAGLGLSIVKEIVGAHGGQVGFQVGAEGGCTFYFLLAAA